MRSTAQSGEVDAARLRELDRKVSRLEYQLEVIAGQLRQALPLLENQGTAFAVTGAVLSSASERDANLKLVSDD